jgi:hypothetical protein
MALSKIRTFAIDDILIEYYANDIRFEYGDQFLLFAKRNKDQTTLKASNNGIDIPKWIEFSERTQGITIKSTGVPFKVYVDICNFDDVFFTDIMKEIFPDCKLYSFGEWCPCSKCLNIDSFLRWKLEDGNPEVFIRNAMDLVIRNTTDEIYCQMYIDHTDFDDLYFESKTIFINIGSKENKEKCKLFIDKLIENSEIDHKSEKDDYIFAEVNIEPIQMLDFLNYDKVIEVAIKVCPRIDLI